MSWYGTAVACSENLADEHREEWVDTLALEGIARFQRFNVGAPIIYRCDLNPCYYYQGETTVTLTPVAAQLVVEADSTHVGSGSVVTFRARARTAPRWAR
jgi:hypothetical protein